MYYVVDSYFNVYVCIKLVLIEDCLIVKIYEENFWVELFDMCVIVLSFDLLWGLYWCWVVVLESLIFE